MRRKETVEIEAVYCDMCGDNITRQNRYGFTAENGDPVDICSGYYSNYPSIPQTCKARYEQQIAIRSADIAFN